MGFDIEIVRAIIDETADTVAKRVVHEQRAEKEGRCKRRLRNTRLLLKNYRHFKAHCTGAVFTDESGDHDGSEEENALEILDLMMQHSNAIAVVESIRLSCRRTKIIMNHIDKILELFKVYCMTQKDPAIMRGYKILEALYIADTESTIDEAAESVGVSVRQAYRDRDDAIDCLSVYMFGVDALDNM